MKVWKFEIQYGEGATYTLEVKRETSNEALVVAATEAAKHMGVDYDLVSIKLVEEVAV